MIFTGGNPQAEAKVEQARQDLLAAQRQAAGILKPSSPHFDLYRERIARAERERDLGLSDGGADNGYWPSSGLSNEELGI